MPLGISDGYGTFADGTRCSEFCKFCFQKGNFTNPSQTLQEMIESSVENMTQDLKMPEDKARSLATQVIPGLKRWITNETEKSTLQYYEDLAISSHGSWTYDPVSFWYEQLKEFKKLLPSGKIIEIGFGTGQEAAALIDMGFDYTGIDVSQGLLKIARKNNPKGKFLYQNVDDLNFPDSSYDGFWACASLLHIHKSRIRDVLRKIQRATKPGGLGFISLIEGIGESVDKKTGRFFSYYTDEEFKEILKEIGMHVIQSTKKMDEAPERIWLTYYLKNNHHGTRPLL